MNASLSPSEDTVPLSQTERQEHVVGVLAALVLAALLIFTAMANRSAPRAGTAEGVFLLTAAFNRADGLYVGSPVRIAGVNIGTVSAATLDDQQRAVLTFQLTQPVNLPSDTAAVIETDGLFGTKYIEFRPGGTEDILKTGAHIFYTQDSVIIEDLVTLIVQRAKGAKAAQTEQAREPMP